MFQHLVVPLDGSFFAEKAIPYATELAAKFGSKITLVQIPHDPPVVVSELGMESADFYMQMRETFHGEAEAYLRQVRSELQDKGFQVDSSVREGTPVAETLVGIAQEIEADAIVMSTHGRSGLGRFFFGSVAEAVLRLATIPVLLVRASNSQEKTAPASGQSATTTP
jgi:nucleotide-binding universal stress UspA family protein